MQVAYLLYDRFTALDITGPHEVLNSVPGNESIFVAEESGPLRNESDTLSLVADASLAEVTRPDIVVVPGGYGTRALLDHEPLLDWLREVHETSTWTTSVCTGALLPRRRGAPRRRPGDNALARPGPARRARGEARRRAGRRARQDRHRRRSVLGNRHGAQARAEDQRR